MCGPFCEASGRREQKPESWLLACCEDTEPNAGVLLAVAVCDITILWLSPTDKPVA